MPRDCTADGVHGTRLTIDHANESPALTQFRNRADYASLYRSIEAKRTPEALYLGAEIYALCAKRTRKSEQQVADERAAERAKFAAALSTGAGGPVQRLDAFDRLKHDPCNGLDVGKFDPETLARLIAAAADAGDPRAQAWQLAERVETGYYDAQRVDRSSSGYRLSAEEFEEARRLLASGDPGVITDLSDLLSSTLAHGVVQLNGQPIDYDALHSAFTLLACDAGARCGPDSTPVLTNCAYRGRCDARTLSEYMFYYETSPSQAQLIDSYHQALLGMMNARDFSGLSLADLDHLPGFSMVFGGRRAIWPDDPYVGNDTDAPKKSAPVNVRTRRDA